VQVNSLTRDPDRKIDSDLKYELSYCFNYGVLVVLFALQSTYIRRLTFF
jgi:hypothetical protein